MNQEQNSYQNPQQEPEYNKEQLPTNPPKKNTYIYWVIIGLLLAISIYLFVSKNNVSEQKEQSDMEAAVADSARRAVETDYSAALVRLDELVSKNSQLDSLLSGRDSEIGKLKSQIQGILSNSRATAEDLAKARSLITRLNSRVKTYQERIAELEAQNKQLNDYSELLLEERDSTVTQNIGLAQKVRLASVLHVSNIRMVPIDLRRGGRKEKETSKARRTDVLRIYFDIDENRVAESGNKELHLQIISPDGNILSNAAYGSGVTSTYDGQTLNYTLAKQVNLQQGQPVNNVMVDWNQDSDYAKGAYTINIYHDGYLIGNDKVQLK